MSESEMHSRSHTETPEVKWVSRKERGGNTPSVAIASPNLSRVHDEPFRRAPDIKERIAGHECQVAPGSPRQYFNIGRAYDFGFRDGIPRCACWSLQGKHVVRMNDAQRTEVGI